MGELITKTGNLEVCKIDDGASSNFNVTKNYKFVTNSKHARRKNDDQLQERRWNEKNRPHRHRQGEEGALTVKRTTEGTTV